jgi:hypothetical protein
VGICRFFRHQNVTVLESVQIFDTVHNSHNSVSDPLTHGTARDWISAFAVHSSRDTWAGRIIAKISLSAWDVQID